MIGKRLTALAIAAGLCISGCSAQGQAAQSSQQAQQQENSSFATTVERHGMTVDIPSGWSVVEKDDGILVTSDYGAMVSGAKVRQLYPDAVMEEYMGMLVDALMSSGIKLLTKNGPIDRMVGEARALYHETSNVSNGIECRGREELIFSGDDVYMVSMYAPVEQYWSHEDELVRVFESAKPSIPQKTNIVRAAEAY